MTIRTDSGVSSLKGPEPMPVSEAGGPGLPLPVVFGETEEVEPGKAEQVRAQGGLDSHAVGRLGGRPENAQEFQGLDLG